MTPLMPDAGSPNCREIYVVNLKHGTWRKRVFLGGPSGEYGRKKFVAVRAEALGFADATADIVEFHNRVVETFAVNGFFRSDT